jgi:hypothetical protein
MRYRTLTLILVAFSGYCFADADPVAERKAYWERIVRTEVPVGTPEAALIKWAHGRSLSVVAGSSASARVIGLETVPVRSLVCKEFGISLDVTIGSSGTISSEEVKTLGVCL